MKEHTDDTSTDSKTEVLIPQTITVGEFAKRLEMGPARLIGVLMKNGVMATINESIDFGTASIIADELGFQLKLEEVVDLRPSDEMEIEEELTDLQDRPPVVAVMGHVDHGKTSLLDSIRNAEVVASESGGITQHIGAYQVERNKRMGTFLDTPGHEAFSVIRAHGVRVTDVVVIVVAADDGVKPQTKEAVRLAQEADAGLVVAINKVDKLDADVNKTKQQLSEIGLVPDDWGGDVPCVEVSAKTGNGIDTLLDMVLLVADLKKPQAHFVGSPRGVIIESHMETGKGAVVTLLVQEGRLKTGSVIVAGSTYAKVRALENEKGQRMKAATPGMPVVVTGFKGVPAYGDWFEGVASEKVAKDWLAAKSRETSIKSLVRNKVVSANDIERAVNRGQVKTVAVILKADTQGSVESILQALEGIGNDEVAINIVFSGIGDISENDINTANATGAVVLGFHVSIQSAVNQLAKRTGVTYKLYQIIYELLDDAREWLTSLLEPETITTELGTLELLAIFKTAKDTVICGGKVLSGSVEPGVEIEVVREGEVVGSTELMELKKGSDVVQAALVEEECGMLVKRTMTFAVGDIFRFIKHEQVARTL
ncbi:translation initiation factor IF-2 [bacterium]|nr:translation initiation factor IF-2 [bacterium]